MPIATPPGIAVALTVADKHLALHLAPNIIKGEPRRSTGAVQVQQSGEHSMKFHLFLCATLAVAASSAHAGDWYALGMISRADASFDKATSDNALTSVGAVGLSSSSKDNSNKWRLQLGYRFNDYVAVEGGYIDLGRAKYAATYTGGSAAGRLKAGGPNLSLLGMLPVADGLSLFGELGVIDAKVKANLSATAPAASASDQYSKYKIRPIYGLGAMYDFTEHTGMRVSYERVNAVGEKHRLGRMDVNMYSLGLSYKF
jgi:OOP family OmpA-OmpF porin